MASQTRICAIRLSRTLAERFEWAARQAGGRRRAIEWMLEQRLPAREWFQARMIRPPHSIRVSFRLSRETVKRLRAVTGIQSLSEAVRLLVYFTFVEGIGVSVARPAPATPAVPSFGASPPVSRPAPPPGRSPREAPSYPFHRSFQMGFEHLPALPSGQHYRCEVGGCVNSLADGVLARCAQHDTARSLR